MSAAVSEQHTQADIAELLRQSEDKLQQDVARLDFLQETLGSCQTTTRSMVDILGSFGTRISQLEDSLRPVHRETVNLTRARDNIKAVLESMDGIMGFYDASHSVEKMIHDGPKYQLDKYLEALKTVERAMAYFQANNPDNAELTHLTRLRNTALRALEKEFTEVLQRHSTAVDLDTLLAMEDAELTSGNVFADDVLGTLRRISEYLSRANCTAEIVRAYAQIRAARLNTTLEPLADLASSFNMAATTGRASRASTLITPKSSRRPSAMRKDVLQRKTSLLRKGASDKGETPSRRATELLEAAEGEGGVYEKGTHNFISYAEALLRAMQREEALASKIFDDALVRVLTSLYGPATDNCITQGELLVGTAQRRIARKDFTAVLFVFDVVSELYTKAEKLHPLLAYSEGGENVARFNDLVLSLAEVAYQALLEYKEEILSDANRKLPQDGTVHELTSQTLKFFSTIHTYYQVAGNVLLGPGKYGDRRHGFRMTTLANSNQRLGAWIFSVLQALSDNLMRKSKGYDNPVLAAIFMMNNDTYVLNYLKTDVYSTILEELGSNYAQEYEAKIRQHHKEYNQGTWGRILAMLECEENHTQPTKKERESIKMKYDSFNTSFEDICRTQQQYAIPSKALRDRVRAENARLIVPKFRDFDQTYRHSGFSTKNPHKYLRFTPDEVTARLERFFDLAS